MSGGARAAYPALDSFKDEQEHSTELRATFGSEGKDFVVFNSNKGSWRAKYASSSLTDKLHQSDKKVKVVAMGMNSTHVVLFTNGSFHHKCSNTYPSLSKLLEETKRGELLVSDRMTLTTACCDLLTADYCGNPSSSL